MLYWLYKFKLIFKNRLIDSLLINFSKKKKSVVPEQEYSDIREEEKYKIKK